MADPYFQAFIYLLAAVITVPIAKRLGLGSVLGYLIAGAAIGPFVFNVAGDTEDVMDFAEFGVVMMLFLIGLELQPARLWELRRSLVGLGLAQVLGTTAVIATIGMTLGFSWQMSLAMGLVLAMSSTAIALQSLREKGLMKTPAGESSFSVLLFQDIAVIPILVILPMLATLESGPGSASKHVSALSDLAPWLRALIVVAVMCAIVIGGRYLIRPVFRYMASTRLREIFTAFALLLVIGIAQLMQVIGLSAALGTFLAGVLLADSEYRHQLEADIEPFKGLLLGLFFISVGSRIDFGFVTANAGMILSVVLVLLLVKFVILLVIGAIFKLPSSENFLFSFALSQSGEFAFVLLGVCEQDGVLREATTAPLTAAVALSMAATPLLLLLNDRLIQPRFSAARRSKRAADDFSEYHSEVLIAGFGRFGHVVGRILRGSTVHTTVLDHDADWVDTLRKFGMHTYYGDATREDLLQKAGAAGARVLVVAIDDVEQSMSLVETAQREFPHLQIFARAADRIHATRLLQKGVEHVYRETLGSSLDMTVDVMIALGFQREHAKWTAKMFRLHDEKALRETLGIEDETNYAFAARQHIENLERLLRGDEVIEPPPVENRDA